MNNLPKAPSESTYMQRAFYLLLFSNGFGTIRGLSHSRRRAVASTLRGLWKVCPPRQ